jgi:hypothetical protein
MLNSQLAIFSVSKFNQNFTNIVPIEENLTLALAEKLSLKLNQVNEWGDNYFIYSPQLTLVEQTAVATGHAIEVVTGSDRRRGIIEDTPSLEDREIEIMLNASIYCNPQSILDKDISISASGGPSPYLPVLDVTRNGNVYQRFWYCRNGTLTGGCAVEYFVEVPLWEFNVPQGQVIC